MPFTMKHVSLTLLTIAAISCCVFYSMYQKINSLQYQLYRVSERMSEYQSGKHNNPERNNSCGLLKQLDMAVALVLSMMITFIVYQFNKQEIVESSKGMSEIYFETETALIERLSALKNQENKTSSSVPNDSGLAFSLDEILASQNITDMASEAVKEHNGIHYTIECTEGHPFQSYIQCFAN